MRQFRVTFRCIFIGGTVGIIYALLKCDSSQVRKYSRYLKKKNQPKDLNLRSVASPSAATRNPSLANVHKIHSFLDIDKSNGCSFNPVVQKSNNYIQS